MHQAIPIKEFPVLTTMLITQLVVLFVAPIALGFWLNRRLGLSWMLFLGGALAFVISWIITSFLPLPAELGLLIAAVAQMGSLYLIYRFMLNTVNTEREALMVGAGQGGIELIILVAFLMLPTFTQMQSLRDASDATLIDLIARTDDVSEEEVQPSRIDELRENIDDYWSTPWYAPPVQTVTSLTILPIQMTLAIIVLSALIQDNLRHLVGAMALYFLARTLPIFASLLGGVVAWLLLSLIFAGIAIWFLKRLWPVIQEQTKAALKERRKAQRQVQRSQ
jgi:uncharacterized membrane protein YhfC